MPVHYLADAILSSIDHRNPESRQLDHDDASPAQVGANRMRAKILPAEMTLQRSYCQPVTTSLPSSSWRGQGMNALPESTKTAGTFANN